MKRFVLILISSCAMLIASAQEEIVLDSIQKISVQPDDQKLNTTRPALFDDSFQIEKINLYDKPFEYQPLIPDYSKNLDFICLF